MNYLRNRMFKGIDEAPTSMVAKVRGKLDTNILHRT